MNHSTHKILYAIVGWYACSAARYALDGEVLFFFLCVGFGIAFLVMAEKKSDEYVYHTMRAGGGLAFKTIYETEENENERSAV